MGETRGRPNLASRNLCAVIGTQLRAKHEQVSWRELVARLVSVPLFYVEHCDPVSSGALPPNVGRPRCSTQNIAMGAQAVASDITMPCDLLSTHRLDGFVQQNQAFCCRQAGIAQLFLALHRPRGVETVSSLRPQLLRGNGRD